MRENFIKGTKNRVLQIFAKFLPGAKSLRILLHRLRGMSIGKGVWIGYDNIFETAHPYLISIGNNVTISMRVTIIAHFEFDESSDPQRMQKEKKYSIHIEDNVFIGPGTIILPNVTIGEGSVVAAGSVVCQSVPSHTMVRGNPAKPIAQCNSPLTFNHSYKKFKCNLRPLKNKTNNQ